MTILGKNHVSCMVIFHTIMYSSYIESRIMYRRTSTNGHLPRVDTFVGGHLLQSDTKGSYKESELTTPTGQFKDE